MPRVEFSDEHIGRGISQHDLLAPSLQHTASRVRIKIVCRDHHRERARNLMAEGGSDRDGGIGTFLGIR
jgi:hypothetical protein